MQTPPTLAQIRAAAERLSPYIVRTPTVEYYGSQVELASGTRLWLKLELLQKTGSFKPRGALNTMMGFDDTQKASGVTAFSAGNHAIATAFAAQILDIPAKVVMPESANPFRVSRCRSYGAEIEFGADISALMKIVEDLQAQEQLTLVHPFEGPATTEGAATVGLELCEDAGELDMVLVPVGGGGLISGVASAVKHCFPDCRVVGVEPQGACGMSDSLERGAPLEQVQVDTIADSLGAPMHKPYSFAVVQQTVDEIVTVSDQALSAAMGLMFSDLKLAVEPAGAAALAALLGPLKTAAQGQRVGIIVCGANIDFSTYSSLLTEN